MKHKIEDEMDATRIELAQKNMQIQSLQYDLYKLQEKYENERRALFKEVEFGREKIALLNQEIRRLKQPEQEDTICMMRWVVQTINDVPCQGKHQCFRWWMNLFLSEEKEKQTKQRFN